MTTAAANAEWLQLIKNAEKSSFISGKVRKIHYKFPDGREMAEEYSMETGVVLRRLWKKKKDLMGESEWELELGDPVKPLEELNSINANFHVRESNTEPILTKRITKRNIEWRIRNLPYPIETYLVTADPVNHCIMVRTTNKKYFKRIFIPELDRCGIPPEQRNITVHHQYNTLIITYKKPQILCDMEVEVLKVLKDVETETDMEDVMEALFKK